MEFIFHCLKFNKFGIQLNKLVIIRRVNLIGAGNLGQHLARAMALQIQIVDICSFSGNSAKELAIEVGARAVKQLSDLSKDVDLNIVCVKDDMISLVASRLDLGIPVVHTSGTMPLDVFSGFDQSGIIYPLQTFSRGRSIYLNEVPFLLEANDRVFFVALKSFCNLHFSEVIMEADSNLRKQIHISAVFAANFSTYMLLISDELLRKNNIESKLLEPLIRETISKFIEIGGRKALTGPARRKDLETIAEHLELLKDSPYASLYEIISKQIMNLNIKD